MGHFVNDHVFQQVFWFFDEFGVEADVFGFGVAATPFCFHALEVVVGDGYAELLLPLGDEGWDGFVE